MSRHRTSHGGARPGAGRKTGNNALGAEGIRAIILKKFQDSLEPIVDKAITQAKAGDYRAREWLSERAMGRVPQAFIPPDGEGEIIIRWRK